MTDWTQYHPTQTLTAPDGRQVDIDLEMVPLVQELWRLGIETKVACQDAGEAVREGGTRTAPADRPQAAARLMGRAWLIVNKEDGPRLQQLCEVLGNPADWRLQPVIKDTDPERWVSLTFPRTLIGEATRLLRCMTVPQPAEAIPSGKRGE